MSLKLQNIKGSGGGSGGNRRKLVASSTATAATLLLVALLVAIPWTSAAAVENDQVLLLFIFPILLPHRTTKQQTMTHTHTRWLLLLLLLVRSKQDRLGRTTHPAAWCCLSLSLRQRSRPFGKCGTNRIRRRNGCVSPT